MYPQIRVDKLHPDGSPRASWSAYRVADERGAIRIWTPPKTTRVHVNGRWTPEAPLITVWSPDERFVTHFYLDAEGPGLYVDIIRAAEVTPRRFAYVDLFVDVMWKDGRAWSKDEELLVRLEADEASAVGDAADRLLAAAAKRRWPFDLTDPRYIVPPDALALAAGPVPDLPV